MSDTSRRGPVLIELDAPAADPRTAPASEARDNTLNPADAPPIDWLGGALAAVALSTLLFSIVLAPVEGITPVTGTTIVVSDAATAVAYG